MNSIFCSLAYRNYRLFFIGQGISLIGVWMTRLATGWLVYRLTYSPLMLGIVSCAALAPSFLLGPLAGVLADRSNRRRLLIFTQVGLMLQVFTLSFLTYTSHVQIWQILVLSLIQGIINGFDIPARQAFLADMIEERKDLGNAIALNSSLFNGARLLGPALADIIITRNGEALCFLIDGLSYLAVIASLLAIQIKHEPVSQSSFSLWKDLKDGWNYVTSTRPIRWVLLMVAWGSMIGLSYLVLFPVIADKTLHGGPHTLGFLTAASGMGALGGALYLATRKNVFSIARQIVFGAALGGVSLIFFSYSITLISACLLAMAASFGFMVQMASCNTAIQTIVDDDKRGRIMSFYSMAFMGMAPLGAFWVGLLANATGAAAALLICGILCLISSVCFSFNLPFLENVIQPIVVRQGIAPKLVPGIDVASQLSSPKD